MKQILLAVIGGFTLMVSSLFAESPQLSFGGKGIVLSAPGMGEFLMTVPNLMLGETKIEQPAFDPSTGDATYPCGAKLNAKIDGARITFTYSGVPEGSKAFKWQVNLPSKFNLGGKYSIAGKEAVPFPIESNDQYLEQGKPRRITITDAMGAHFSIQTSAAWFGLQDSRTKGSKKFVYQMRCDFVKNPANSQFTVDFSE